MGISEKKMQIVIDNYFKQECDINTSIRGAFEKGFRIGVKKGQSAQPEPHWIPCRKKLPEKAGAYLVQALMNGDIFAARWQGSYWNVKTPVVAWMPLPEPYRGGDSE